MRLRRLIRLGGIVAGIGGLLGVGYAGAVVTLARLATMPDPVPPGLRLVRVDRSRASVTLTRTRESSAPGLFGLRLPAAAGYAFVGDVVELDDSTVTRRLIHEAGRELRAGDTVDWSGWYYDNPGDCRLPFEDVLVETPVGPAPAWFVAGGDGSRWVIHIHGRGAARGECVRGLDACRSAGLSSLVISYRNDGEAPASADHRYALGAAEWRDVDAAVRYAHEHGAREILLWGWSMGGALALSEFTSSPSAREVVSGLILESPVVDWRSTLRHQAQLRCSPSMVTDAALALVGSARASKWVGQGEPIPLDSLDFVRRAAEVTVPVLLLCSAGDDVVPFGPSQEFARRLPNLVTLAQHPTAQHARLWNSDPLWWQTTVSDWLRRWGYDASCAET